ncbi:hypothetical protein JXA40_10165 [bacterium]|nr:hypothetical protein [candidate division CSSED10-310 bacterium]
MNDRTIWEKMMQVDRRVIYLIVAIVMIVPIIFPFDLPIKISKRTTLKLFNAIEKFPEQRSVFFISADLNPQDQPELYPMLVSWIRHCFHRKIKVLVMCLYPTSLGLAEQALNQVSTEFNNRASQGIGRRIVYGEDYVFLGYKPPPIVPILGLGENIFDVFPRDFYGNELKDYSTLPMMENIKNYRDMDMIGSIAANTLPVTYIAYAQARYGIAVTGGVTAVSVADFYPYLDSGQLTGMLEGMKGAAEYEGLIRETFPEEDGRRLATEGMSAQSTTHLAIILMVVLGNVCFFMQRRHESRRG